MRQKLVAVFAGFFFGAGVIATIEWLGHKAFPLPPGIDANDPASLAANAHLIPVGAMAMVVVAWFLGTLAAVTLATKFAPESRRGIALVLGLLFLAAGLANLTMIPSPVWMCIGGVLAFPAGAALGLRLGTPRAPAA